LRGLTELALQELEPERLADGADLVFLALPHLESQRVVPVLRARGVKVIDLSADYRLRDPADYTTWYKSSHSDPAGLAEAVYGLAGHRHTPEIEQELSLLAGQPVRVAFTPHLIPVNRGLLTTASVPLARSVTTGDLRQLYAEFYAGEPFVRLAREGEGSPTTR